MTGCIHRLAYYDETNNRFICPCCGMKWISNEVSELVKEQQDRIRELERELAEYDEGWAGK